MDQRKKRIIFLLDAYTNNSITALELEELYEYTAQSESDVVLNEFMQSYWDKMQEDKSLIIPFEEIFQKITAATNIEEEQSQSKIIRFRKLIAYAAAVLLIASVAIALYLSNSPSEPKNMVAKNKDTNISLPGSKKAVLTLADGSQMVLQDSATGVLAFQGQSQIEQQNGLLIYKTTDNSLTANTNALNKIVTPKGTEYQLVLVDGTKVWLNSATSLTFPVAFNGRERRVKISGEAYFEVAKNANQPFIVEANGTAVKVLGTHFNVSAYEDDPTVKTTLLEGSVKVSKNKQQAVLSPNQQSVIHNSSDQIAVNKVDPEQAMAWKNGYFMFNNEDIKTVMKVISRWYDIDVEYRGDLSGKTFGGTISRFESIEKLLETLELTDAIHFKVKGRRVIVTP